MPFSYPPEHKTDLYGSFDTVDLFWERFEAEPEWARRFYTDDEFGSTGLAGFRVFVAEHTKDYKGTQCAWFAPQPRHEVLGTNNDTFVFLNLHSYHADNISLGIRAYIWS